MREFSSRLVRHWQENEKSRFLIVGAANTGIGYLAFAMYYLGVGRWVNYMVVAIIAHITAVCIAFFLQKRFVFRSDSPWWPEFARYNISLLGILGFNISALYFLVSEMNWNPLAGQAIVMVFSVIGSYYFHKRFSFSRGRA